MSVNFTDYPRFVERARYDRAVNRVVQRLQQLPGLVSVYQIGSVSTPGISDIDLLAVFDDGYSVQTPVLTRLSRDERYLFVHALFGVRHTDFVRAQRFSFFHNYRHVVGRKLQVGTSSDSKDKVQLLKVQTALEYLCRAFVSLTLEHTYQIVRVRGLLLHVKSLAYDLEFLNLDSGPFYDLVVQLTEWRSAWFDRRPSKRRLTEFLERLLIELTAVLVQVFESYTLFLPSQDSYRLGRNITLQPASRLTSYHEGYVLPNFLARLGRKYFNVQHRFNRFLFGIPITTHELPDVIRESFAFQQQMREYNSKKLPCFIPMSSSLTTY